MIRTIFAAAAATGLLLLSSLGAQGADLLHNSNDTGSYNSKWPNGWGIAGGKYGEFTCATCHEPNNKANLKNVRREIYTENGDLWPNGQQSVSVTFRNQTSMGDDTQAHANSNRICEVCHSKNRFHNFDSANNSAMGHPNPKEVCVNCHKHNTGFKAACGGCHGNPPTTAALGGDTGLIGTPRPSNALIAGQAGAHDKHVNGRSLVCDTCHYISNGGFKMPTQSGSIQIGFFGFGGKVTSGTYVPYTSATRGYPFASGTPNTTIAGAVTDPAQANKCANVYCHGGGAPGKAPLSGGSNQSPKWDGASQSACGSCHGATAANPPTMGSHQKHAGSANGYSLVCDTCHPATDISHVQGNVRWHFSDTDPRVAGATYQAAGSASAVNAGSTGDMAPSAAYGQCSNLYCHTNGRGGAANVATPTWGDSTGFTGCVGCHGGAASSSSPIVSNAHKAHTNNTQAPFDGVRFACAECHSQVVNATNTTIIGSSLHVNSSKNVDWGTLNSGSPAYATSGCSQIYCHSNGKGAYTPPASNWTAVADGTQGTAGCDYCHRGRGADQKPMSSARHTNHITQSPVGGIRHKAVTCDVCHDNTVAPGGTSLIAGGSHLNKGIDINFAKFANRSGSYNAGTRQCSNTYCHASVTMNWTSTTINRCGDCHAANNTTTTSAKLSDAHRKHYNSSTLPTNANGWTATNASSTTSAANVFYCGTCHPTDPENHHINGPASLDGDAAELAITLPFTVQKGARTAVVTPGSGQNSDGRGYFYSSGTTCDLYCHSDANGGPSKIAFNWTTVTASCGNCHNKAGDANPTWSAPHTKHVNTYNGNTNITCNSCHAVTASGNNALLARRDRHPNGFRNVTSNTAAGPFSWDGDRCSNSYCHYGTSPSWSTGSGTLPSDCTGCHGNDASSGRPMNKNAHKAHVNNQSARFNGFNFRCNECHNSTVAADNRTITGYTVHANGSKTVVWGTLSNGGAAYSAGACSQIYCHSNGQTTPTYKAPANWTSVADGTEGTANCDYCHGGQATDATPISSNRHTNHITTSPAGGIRHRGVTCDTCHDLTAAPGGTSILASGGNHLNRKIDINFAKFSTRSGSYTSGTRTCSVTYCHGRSNPTWTTTTINNCGSCHRGNNSATSSLSAPHLKHYNSSTLVTTNNGWTNTNASTTTNHVFYCGVCHAVNPEADHVNGPISLNGAAAQIVFNIPKVPSDVSRPNTFTYGTSQNQDGAGYIYSTGTTCDVYCHSDGRGGPSKTQFNWTSTVFACGECHNSTGDGDPNPTWSTPHTRHIRGYAEGGNTNFGCYVCHKSTVNATSTTIANKSKHINGYRNISSSTYGNFTYDPATKGCTANYCHSEGKSITAPYTQTGTVTWNTAGPLACNSCHTGGTGGSTQGPTYTTGKANSHPKHAFTCEKCHNGVVNATGAIIAPSLHVNKSYDLQAGGGQSFTVTTQGTPTVATVCSNISCHGGSGTTATWGGALSCSGCHLSTAADLRDYTYNNGTRPNINSTEWAYSGHGKASGTYDKSGRPAAAFTAGAGGDACFYCHDNAVLHTDTGNPFRLRNFNDPTYGKNGVCLACHATGATGVDPDGSGTVYANRVATTKVNKYHYGAKHATAYSGGQFCWDCHDGHGDRSNSTTGSISMIRTTPIAVSDSTTGVPITVAASSVSFQKYSANQYGKTAAPFTGICNVCHDPASGITHYTASSSDSHNSTTLCSGCHQHSSSTTYDGLGFKGLADCVGCHQSQQPITVGPLAGTGYRRAVSLEFANAWSHKSSAGGVVTKYDCIVCHMEGDMSTGEPNTTYHRNGLIELRDPDTGATIKQVTFSGTPGSYSSTATDAAPARFSRDFSVTLEADPNFANIAAIQINLCLKCHDSNGATSPSAQVPSTGTPYRPFGVAVGSTSTYYLNNIAAGNAVSNVMDVKSSFDTNNSSYHPVLGKQNNGFANTAMMKAPWNGSLSPAKPGSGSTTIYGFLISCWDCHAATTDAWGNRTVQLSTVTAHGNSTILRAPNSFTAASSTTDNLCTLCHGGTSNYYATGTSGHGGNSAAANTSGNIGSRHQTCSNCHSSYNDGRPWRAVDAHGFNAMAQLRTDTTTAAGAATWASGSKPFAFIRTSQLGNWRPARGTGLTNASNGTCNQASSSNGCSNSHGTYTPGGWY